MVNVSAQSFERAMHNEATESPRVTVPARTRECKRPSAPGEIPVKMLSDRGSTPLTSTKKKQAALCGLFLFGRVIVGSRTGAGVNDVPGARQSRDLACAAAQVDSPHLHHSDSTISMILMLMVLCFLK